MTKFKRDLTGIAVVDGEKFEWRVYREPQWCTTDGWKGLALVFRHIDGQREAIVEWPMPKSGSNSVPYRQRPTVSSEMVKRGVLAAINAGWDPLSRGRPISVSVEL